MLYEVITARTVHGDRRGAVSYGDRACGEQVRSAHCKRTFPADEDHFGCADLLSLDPAHALVDAAADRNLVSPSDAQGLDAANGFHGCGPNGFGFGGADSFTQVGANGRITSYNVCYTKLLRLIELLVGLPLLFEKIPSLLLPPLVCSGGGAMPVSPETSFTGIVGNRSATGDQYVV